LIIGFYIEINTPGFGIPGWIALLSLALILLSHSAIYAIHWIEMILLLSGIILLLLEIFVIPGFGIAGVLGIILTLLGLFTLILPNLHEVKFSFDTQTFNLAAYALFHHLIYLTAALLFAILLLFLFSKYFLPKFSLFQKIVLKGEQQKEMGFISGADVKDFPSLQSEGIAETPLAPYGKIRVRGSIFEAKVETGFIDKGDKIIIRRIEGNQIIVRKKT
jgi:membrane-bound serine protease (ClpP class)